MIIPIICGIVIEVGTIMKSLTIIGESVMDSNLELADKGYRFKNKLIEAEDVEVGLKIGLIPLLIPGVNMVNAVIVRKRIKKTVVKKFKDNEDIIPMTDEEKDVYKFLKTKEGKYSYLSLLTENKEISNSIHILANLSNNEEAMLISSKQLFPLSYTHDEVKKLNAVTEQEYSIGQLDGVNIAIIGIPKEQKEFKNIRFRRENYSICHELTEISEPDNKTFIVYPYYEEQEEIFEPIIEDIRNSREQSKKNKSIDQLKSIRENIMSFKNLDVHNEQKKEKCYVYKK